MEIAGITNQTPGIRPDRAVALSIITTYQELVNDWDTLAVSLGC